MADKEQLHRLVDQLGEPQIAEALTLLRARFGLEAEPWAELISQFDLSLRQVRSSHLQTAAEAAEIFSDAVREYAETVRAGEPTPQDPSAATDLQQLGEAAERLSELFRLLASSVPPDEPEGQSELRIPGLREALAPGSTWSRPSAVGILFEEEAASDEADDSRPEGYSDLPSWVGSAASGRGDLAERHEEILRGEVVDH
jgi:hypothetical protein